MIYYANPSTEPIRDAIAAGQLGCIVTPAQGGQSFAAVGDADRSLIGEWDVMADNGCFSGSWNEQKWWRWLLDLPRTIRFAVAPDVFDPSGAPCHDATLERWRKWGPAIERHGFTPAFVCQIGATADNVPDAPVLFLGGTTEWKLGSHAWDIVARWGSERWVHMGRVNSKRRLDTARAMGCHSVDGTYLTFGPDVNLPRLLSWLDSAIEHPMLWEAS